MAAILNVWRHGHIYLKNNPAKFHPDPIWNDAALGVFEDGRAKKKKKKNSNKMSSDTDLRSGLGSETAVLCQDRSQTCLGARSWSYTFGLASKFQHCCARQGAVWHENAEKPEM